MRYALSILLLPALLPLAVAQDNDAEKLFRAMEKKIKAANAFQVAFDIEWAQFGEEKKKGKLNGSLLLTKDNKARLKISGDYGRGEKRTEELVSDGQRIKTTMSLKSDWQTSKKFHDLLCTQANRAGVWLSHLGMPYLLPEQEGGDPEMLFHVHDFKAGATEKIGERDAKVVRYKLGKGGGGSPQRGPGRPGVHPLD